MTFPKISIFFITYIFSYKKWWQKSHLVALNPNRSTFDYDLDLSGQIILIKKLNWFILVILSYVWVLTSIYITFKLTFKLLDHFQQCGWIFRLVTFVSKLSKNFVQINLGHLVFQSWPKKKFLLEEMKYELKFVNVT